ncbi:MAG: extracellular solute-binding protein [Candidatus Promineofilum sp.]|nr:extracellular solute-binding protein [Promineifilum sp.]
MSKTPSFFLLCLLLLLAACGARQEIRPTPISPGGGEGGGSADEGGGVGQTVNLRLWTPQNDTHNAADQALIAAYSAANPGVTITLETFDPATYPQMLASALAGGTAADIIHLPGAAACALAAGGALAETPATLIPPADATARFYGAAVGSYTCGDRLYALPQSLDPAYGVALVNTATAAQAGLTDIAAGWATWDELIADARAMAVGQGSGMTRAGFHFIGVKSLPAMFDSLILQNGGQAVTNGALTVNTPQGAAALGLMKRLVDEGAIDPTLFNEAGGSIGQAVIDGRAAMGLVAPSAVAALAAARPDVAAALVAVPLPPAAGVPGLVAGPGRGLAVSRASAAPDVAWDFVRFATLDPANSLQWSVTAGALPALRANGEGAAAEQLVAGVPQFAAWLPLLPLAQPEGVLADRDRVWRDVTYPRLLTFLQGGATLEETLAAIEAATP